MTELSFFRAHGELDQLLHRLGLSTFRDRYQTLRNLYTTKPKPRRVLV